MGTNNFVESKYFDAIYVIEPYTTDDDGNIEVDDMSWEDTRDNVKYELMNIAKENNRNFAIDSNIKLDYNRNYPETSIGNYWDSFTYDIDEQHSITYEINIIAKTVSAYYEGATLDVSLYFGTDEAYIDKFEYDDPKEFAERILEEFNDSLAEDGVYELINDELNNFVEHISSNKKEMLNEVEKAFMMYSTNVNKVGQFSNGEAVYEYGYPDAVAKLEEELGSTVSEIKERLDAKKAKIRANK